MAAGRTRLGEWETLKDEALAKAGKSAEAFEKDMLTNLSPVNEIIAQIIQRDFYASMRDNPWEIEHWQRLFEWERASFRAPHLGSHRLSSTRCRSWRRPVRCDRRRGIERRRS
jgi:hypothetical protein